MSIFHSVVWVIVLLLLFYCSEHQQKPQQQQQFQQQQHHSYYKVEALVTTTRRSGYRSNNYNSAILSKTLLSLSSSLSLTSLIEPTTRTEPSPTTTDVLIVRIPEPIWRLAASNHRKRIHELLRPGLVNHDHPLMGAISKTQQRIKRQTQKQQNKMNKKNRSNSSNRSEIDENNEKYENNDENETDEFEWMTMLDPKHPVYNFLVEYYGLKGLKGPKRLARWSPSIGLLHDVAVSTPAPTPTTMNMKSNDNNNDDGIVTTTTTTTTATNKTTRTITRSITSIEELNKASSKAFCGRSSFLNDNDHDHDDNNSNSNSSSNGNDSGIFLEGATPNDFGQILHLKGAEWIQQDNGDTSSSSSSSSSSSNFNHNLNSNSNRNDNSSSSSSLSGGVIYRPFQCYNDNTNDNDNNNANTNNEENSTGVVTNSKPTTTIQTKKNTTKNNNKAPAFLWYKSILETTLSNEPVLHCYGLHEWAMQYWPKDVNAIPPPSGKYQRHLSLRVSRDIINETVERKGLCCTHVDALRFFAEAAGPLNYHGSSLERMDQLQLENPGCVHAHMDLLKIALKLIPFGDPSLLCDILEISLEARTLDVAASPYDCSDYFYYIPPSSSSSSSSREQQQQQPSIPMSRIPIIKVETSKGRKQYKELQIQLMEKVHPIRQRLVQNYHLFLQLSFTPEQIQEAELISISPSNNNKNKNNGEQRYATTKPGGLPWRQSLISVKSRSM